MPPLPQRLKDWKPPSLPLLARLAGPDPTPHSPERPAFRTSALLRPTQAQLGEEAAADREAPSEIRRG